MNLDLLAAKVTIGATGSIEIIETAYNALDEILSGSDGTRTDTFLELATADDLTAFEAEVLLKKSFGELGKPWPSHDEAVNRLIVYWLSLIVEKRIEPRDGMSEVKHNVLDPGGELSDCVDYVGDMVSMAELMGAFYSYEDIYGTPNTGGVPLMPPEDARREIDRRIIELSRDWIDRFAGNDRMRPKTDRRHSDTGEIGMIIFPQPPLV